MPRIDLTGWALLLIAMAVGYIICLKASKEQSKLFRLSGTVIGIVVVAVSIILALSTMVNFIRLSSRSRARRRPPTTTSRRSNISIPSLPTLPGGSERTVPPTRIPNVPELPDMPEAPPAPQIP